MSVNTSHANGGVLIHAGETILLFSDNVSMEFAGQDVQLFKGTKTGRIYLTTHRIIFNSKNAKDPLQSFSAPFICMNDVELEQPVFGANYIRGKIRAQQNGNFNGETKFKLAFKSGGCIDFGQALLRAASLAQRNGGGMAPPPYTAPSSAWYAAPPPAYSATPGAYGWIPHNDQFFGTPPANGVYMHDNPPPYPGINPTYSNGSNGFGPASGAAQPPPPQYGFAAQQGPGHPSNSAPGYPPAGPSYPNNSNGFAGSPSAPPSNLTKEQEAAASAYYDPRAPNSAFVQQPQFYESPPSYSEVDQTNKKTN